MRISIINAETEIVLRRDITMREAARLLGAKGRKPLSIAYKYLRNPYIPQSGIFKGIKVRFVKMEQLTPNF